jgi:hypothetical protein
MKGIQRTQKFENIPGSGKRIFFAAEFWALLAKISLIPFTELSTLRMISL